MEKVRPWCGQPSDRGRLKNGTERNINLRDYAQLSWLGAAHHGVALAGARLSVREDTDVVAVDSVLQHLEADVFIDLLLAGVPRVAGLQRMRRQWSAAWRSD